MGREESKNAFLGTFCFGWSVRVADVSSDEILLLMNDSAIV